MRKYTILVLAILPTLIFSQTTTKRKADARLYEIYDAKYIQDLLDNDPFWIHRWEFYLDNAFFISDSPLSKTADEDNYPTVSIKDLSHINILKLEKEQNLKRNYFTETVYKIDGTGKYLVYISGREFVEKLNEYLKTTKSVSK